jgi:inner membrane organizing system protein 1
MAEKSYRSEDEMGLKLDRCVADTLLKVAGGLAIGVVASVALFKV